MSDLRSEIANQVFDAIQGENDIEDASDAAERILAAVVAAMTSDAAVEAAEDGMYITISSGEGTRPLIYEEGVPSAYAAITAALRVAGVKGGAE